MMAAVGSVFLEELTLFCTANIAILSFAAAEIVKFAAQYEIRLTGHRASTGSALVEYC